MNYNDLPTRFELVSATRDNHFAPFGQNLSLVDLYNGELYNLCRDALYKGAQPFPCTRLFRSGRVESGRFGRGWSSGYDILLEVDGPVAIFHDELGQTLVFEQEEDGSYRSAELPLWHIRKEGDGYILNIDMAREIIFNAQGLPVNWRLLATEYHLSLDYDEQGRLLGISDNLSRSMKFQYNKTGRVSQLMLYPTSGGAEPRVVGYSYTKQGELAQVEYDGWTISYTYQDGRLATIAEPDGRVLNFAYDDKNRIAHCSYKADFLARAFHYNEKQRTATVEGPAESKRVYSFNTKGHVTQLTDESGRHWLYTWDRAGRLVSVKNPSGLKLQITYDDWGRPVAASDQTGWKRELHYNEQGLVAEIANAYGIEARFFYDDARRLEKIECPAGLEVQVQTDARGFLEKLKLPNGFAYQFERDARGNVTRRFNSAGQEFQFEYDEFNNLKSVRRPDGLSVQRVVNASGLLISERLGKTEVRKFSYSANGGLLEALVGTTRTRYSYTETGRISQELIEVGQKRNALAHRALLSYQYDAGERLTSIKSADYEVDYLYNAALSQVQVSAQGVALTIKGFPTKRAVSINFPNGLRRELRYTEGGQLARLTDYNGRQSVLNQLYTYDKLGRVASYKTAAGKLTYNYDELGRVVAANFKGSDGATTESFEYDPLGNVLRHRAPAGTSGFLYQNGIILQSDEAATYVHDVVGRLVEVHRRNGDKWTFGYDAFDRLISVEAVEAGGARHQVEYVYDYRGVRIGRILDGAASWLIYGRDNLLYETQAQGTRTNSYVNGLQLDEPYLLLAGQNYYCYHTDRLGNIIALSDQQGSFINRYRYALFGQRQIVAERVAQPLAFQAREYEPVGGLQYQRNRFYWPEIFRFLTPDPIGLAGGLHPYTFVDDDPSNYTDPWGFGGTPTPTAQPSGPTSFDRHLAYGTSGAGIILLACFPEYRLIRLIGVSISLFGLYWQIYVLGAPVEAPTNAPDASLPWAGSTPTPPPSPTPPPFGYHGDLTSGGSSGP